MKVIEYLDTDLKLLFEGSELKISEFELIEKNRKKRNYIPYQGEVFYIPDFLPSFLIPKFQIESHYIKNLIESAYLLKEPRSEYNFANNLNPCLYDLIKLKRLIPKNILSENTIDIAYEIDNYHKLLALHGFFNKAGIVFEGEQKKEKFLENYYDWLFMLERDKVLRK